MEKEFKSLIESVDIIKELFEEDTSVSMESILKSINELGKIADKQADSTKEVSISIDEIALSSQELVMSVKNA